MAGGPCPLGIQVTVKALVADSPPTPVALILPVPAAAPAGMVTVAVNLTLNWVLAEPARWWCRERPSMSFKPAKSTDEKRSVAANGGHTGPRGGRCRAAGRQQLGGVGDKARVIVLPEVVALGPEGSAVARVVARSWRPWACPCRPPRR
jgi:hypothetical protein